MTMIIEKDDHVRGSGPVTILVYGDYECPYTRALELVIRQLFTRDGDTFRYAYRYFPLREIHPHAQMAAEAAESVYAAGGADAFWRMHDALFADQYHLEPADLEESATATGVNMRGLSHGDGETPIRRAGGAGRAERHRERRRGHAVHFHQWRAVSRQAG